MLFFHGGAFVEGDKDQLERYAREFAGRGYVTATCQYRLADEATFPAALVDVKAAIEWLRSEGEGYGVDGRKIAAVGWSAGANLAALAAVTANEPGFEPEVFPGISSDLQAVVGYAGVYDFEWWTTTLNPTRRISVDSRRATDGVRPRLAGRAGHLRDAPDALVHGSRTTRAPDRAVRPVLPGPRFGHGGALRTT